MQGREGPVFRRTLDLNPVLSHHEKSYSQTISLCMGATITIHGV